MNIGKNACIFLCITTLFISGYVPAQTRSNKSNLDVSEFPVPDQPDGLLFYIQLSVNINTVIYEVNTLADNSIDPHNPVNIFWINYSTDGKRAELTPIQKTFAYGVSHQIIKGKGTKEDSYVLKIVSYKKRPIYIVKSQTGKYCTYATINGKICRFKHIFVKIDGGTFWVPNVKYVMLYGEDLQTKQIVSEKIIP